MKWALQGLVYLRNPGPGPVVQVPDNEPRDRMRILEIETFGRGGLLHYAHNLAAALAESGHRVTLLTSASFELEGDAKTADSVRVEKVVGRLSRRFGERLPRLLRRFVLKAEAIIDAVSVAVRVARLRPDVVHFHSTNTSALLYLALLRLVGRPIVVTAHVVTPHEPMRFQTTVYGWMHRLARLSIAHSEFDRKRLIRELRVPAERIRVIPHGEYGFFGSETDASDRRAAREWLGLAPDAETALFFGYIREYKGLDLLLDAWPQVAEERPRARLVAAGDPVQLPPARRRELEEQADRLGAVRHFRYVPFSDVQRYFAAADVLVMPYRHISQSGVLFLALSLGVPVLATRVGGLGELLKDGRTAVLVEPESADALAEGLLRVLGDEELRTRLAQEGKRLAYQHSWASIAERTEREFERLAGSGPE